MIDVDPKRLFGGRALQIIAVATGSSTLISDGMQYAWTSPIVTVLESPSSPVPIQDSDIIWLENLYTIGGFVGLVLIILMFDQFGRKRSLIVLSVLSVIAWTLIAFASSIGLLFGARFIFGITGNGNFYGLSIYTAEIADKTVRGRLQTLILFLAITGNLLIYAIGATVSIKVSSGIGGLIVVFQLLTFSFMPESPYYFLIHSRRTDALTSLEKVRSTSDTENELHEIAEAVEKENAQRGRPLDLITIKSNRNACFLVTFLGFAEQYSGITVILMNMHMILEDAPLILSKNTVPILFSLFTLVACVISVFLIDSMGRKFLLYSSCFATAVPLLLLASYYAVKSAGINVDRWNWLPVVALILYAITYQCGLGIVPMVLFSEVYPTNIKAVGIIAYSVTYTIASVTAISLFHHLKSNYGMHAAFFLFGACCVISGVIAVTFVPETKGITLEEVQLLLNGDSTVDIQGESGEVNYGTNT